MIREDPRNAQICVFNLLDEIFLMRTCKTCFGQWKMDIFMFLLKLLLFLVKKNAQKKLFLENCLLHLMLGCRQTLPLSGTKTTLKFWQGKFSARYSWQRNQLDLILDALGEYAPWIGGCYKKRIHCMEWGLSSFVILIVREGV